MKNKGKISTFDEAIDVLLDGSKEQIANLKCPECGGPISYRYFAGREAEGVPSALDVFCSCQMVLMHKMRFVPNCVKHFGNRNNQNISR
jgi:hypothetical protein